MISNDTMDIIAYYLSEYDMMAFTYLGYKSQASGFREIAGAFGRKDSYLRRLRDEHQIIETGSVIVLRVNESWIQKIIFQVILLMNCLI